MKKEMDIKSLVGNLPVLQEIEKVEKDFYQLLKDKDIEPKCEADVERMERFFNKALRDMQDILDKSGLDSFEKKFLKIKLTIDFHGRTAEMFGIDVMYFPQLLGKYNSDLFTKAVNDFKLM